LNLFPAGTHDKAGSLRKDSGDVKVAEMATKEFIIGMLRKLPSEAWAVTKETFQGWSEHNVLRMSAALAFYTTFSAAPALLIGLGVAGAFIGRATAKSQLIERIEEFVSPEVAAYVVVILDGLWGELTGGRLPIIGIGAAAVAATAVFVELHSSLNTIWCVKPSEASGILSLLYSRMISFVLIVGIGVLLLVSAIAGTVLSAINVFFTNNFPVLPNLLQGLDRLILIAMLPVLLALAYKLIPDADVAWKDVLLGSVVGGLLFFVGKWVFGFYLRHSMMLSFYGAAGSLVILLLWVYYSAQVFFLGAELTKVYATRYGSHRRIEENVNDGTSGELDYQV
jgi:membrane protein